MSATEEFVWTEDDMNRIVMPFLRNAEKLVQERVEQSQKASRKDMEQYWVQVCLSWSYHFPKPLNVTWLEVRDSQHGLGVFATCDIPIGRYLTFYPIHFVKYDGIVIGNTGEKIDERVQGLDHVNGASIWGDTRYHENTGFIGHMINDPCPDITYKEGEEFDWLVRYALAADSFANVKFVKEADAESDCVWVVVKSTKDIPRGTELLLPYTPLYWMRNFQDLKPRLRDCFCELSEQKREFLSVKFEVAMSAADCDYFVS